MKRSNKIFEFSKNEEGNVTLWIRYTTYKKGKYIDTVDYLEKNGLIANFIVFIYRRDDFAKKNYSFYRRFLWFTTSFAAEELDRKIIYK